MNFVECLGHGIVYQWLTVFFLFSLQINQFLEEALSFEIEEPHRNEKQRCTSIVKRCLLGHSQITGRSQADHRQTTGRSHSDELIELTADVCEIILRKTQIR